MPVPTRLRRTVAAAVLGLLLLAAMPAASANPAATRAARTPQTLLAAAQAASRIPAATATSPRQRVPEDRYAMANGCYTVRSALRGRYLHRSTNGPRATVSNAKSAEPFHFQATDLGAYLLYATDSDFLAASEGELGKAADAATDSSVGAGAGGLTVGATDKAADAAKRSPANTASGRGQRIVFAAKPSELADWEVTRNGDGSFRFALPAVDRVLSINDAGVPTLVASSERGRATEFSLALAEGCAAWPEIQTNVEGAVATGETPYSEVRGYNDAHLHSMAFEFIGGRIRCGRPWHRFGAPYALRGCKEHEIAGGRAAVAENVLSGRDTAKGHDTNAGWPTFTDWPKPGSLTYEQVYYKWLERAWRGGLRMYTNLLVDNNQLCKVYPYKKNSCNEMDGVRLQAQRIQEFSDYIDAQSGGPGEGWFRIVDDPFEARRVMNAGKLAVVLGIEVSRLFDCQTVRGVSTCTAQQIDQRLDEVYALGVRQMELVNKFDNALSGVTGDGGIQGPIVNNANFLETGSYWPMKTCKDEHTHAHDKEQMNFHDESGAPEQFSGRDSLVGILLSEFGGTGAAPVYGPGPHCSQLGLSPLGEHLIRRMMEKNMIFDPDHMSAKARDQAMDLIEAEQYSGVISSHSWADDTIYPRIWKMGGVVTPHAGSSTSFVEKWRKQRSFADDRFLFGLGFGSDMNGFSNQGQPRGANAPNPVRYPFTGLGGVTISKQVSGQKTYDFNVDGVAHYGMYPDFVEDVRNVGGADGDQIVEDMQRGAEAFLQMWERAVGVAPDACRADIEDLQADDMNRINRGMTAEQVLVAIGQPSQRDGNTFTYCVDGGTATVTFDEAGRVTGTTSAPVDATSQQRAAAPEARRQQAATGSSAATTSSPRSGKASPKAVAAHDHRRDTHDPVALANSLQSAPALRWGGLALFAPLFVVVLLRRGRRTG